MSRNQGRRAGRRAVVSVVVPVYNVEKYLRECLDSLRSQTCEGMEVLVVLDAPTDASAGIAREYTDDPRFRIIEHPVNQGLASARNTGLDAATGEYVGFVDSDDFVAPDAFQQLLDAARENDADMVSCGYTRVSEQGEPQADHVFPLGGRALRTGPELAEAMERAHADTTLWFAWRNLYRRAMIDVHGIRFDPELRTGEDMPFNLRAFYSAKRWAGVEEPLYMYRHSPQGLTMSPHVPHLLECLQRAYDLKMDTYRQVDASPAAFTDMRLYVIRNLFPRLLVNAVRDPETARRSTLMVRVLDSPMVVESLAAVSAWDRRLPRGIRVSVALAKIAPRSVLQRYVSLRA